MGMVELALIGKLKKTKADKISVYNKTEIDNIVSPLSEYFAQSTEPLDANAGDIWFNTQNGQTKLKNIVNDEVLWVSIGSGSSSASPLALTESDIFTVTDPLITTYDFSYIPSFVQVYVNRVKLRKTEFVAANGSSITILIELSVDDEIEFVTAPLVLNESDVVSVSDSMTKTYNFTYITNFIQVYWNRIKLRNTEYIAANGTSITILIDLEVGDELEFISLG